jgi:hypothetical protein
LQFRRDAVGNARLEGEDVLGRPSQSSAHSQRSLAASNSVTVIRSAPAAFIRTLPRTL